MDPVLLARIQFAMTIGFHFIFPPISIGLAWLLVLMEGMGWRQNNDTWRRAARFFGKLFAINFAVGVATGVVMEFQFGTNWADYSRFVGDIFGAPLAAEGVFAFFMESGFLGLYLFGRDKVSPRIHWVSILMVAFGATLSGFWIIVANSWQQTPAGYVINEAMGRAELVDFAAAVFNPSTLHRYFHVILSALVAGSFFVSGASAWMILKGKDKDVMGHTLKLGVIVGLIASILIIFPSGHEHARQVAATQPEKFAAIEGLYTTQKGAPLAAFGVPDPGTPPELRAAIEIPSVLSWMAFGDLNAEVKGLDAFPADEIPPLWMTFVSFHNMVILGTWFVFITALGVVLMKMGKLIDNRKYLWAAFLSAPLPIVAIQFGWVTAEVGRQPWIVYKLLKTADAISVSVSATEILISLLLLGFVYIILGGLYFYLLFREMDHGVPTLPGKEVV